MSILSIRIKVNHVADGFGKSAAVNANAVWNAIGEVKEDGVDGLAVLHIGLLQFANGAGDERELWAIQVQTKCSDQCIDPILIGSDLLG